MPHSMKYPTTRLPPPGPRAAELDGPAAANGIATATAVRITKAAARRPVFMSPLFGGVPQVVRTTSRRPQPLPRFAICQFTGRIQPEEALESHTPRSASAE